MRRREFITLIGGAAVTWPRCAFAQADRVRRIGVLSAIDESDPEAQTRMAALREGLAQRGWTEGGNLRIDARWAGNDREHMARYAAELVALKPDVIVAVAPPPLIALKKITRTVPIVFVQVPDPVAEGYVASLARPGGNITGFANFEQTIAVKWLELLKQIAPRVTRIAVLYYSGVPSWRGYLREIETGLAAFRVSLSPISLRTGTEIESAIDDFANEPNGGLIVFPSPVTTTHRQRIIDLAARYSLPAVYPYRYFVVSGGLASYGIDNHDLYKRAASYVDRILKGEKPADLPVQQATKFELVINLKIAKALGLDIPITVLARTDEVIE
jgi:putative ABC transport system substrate-binding protein